MLPPRIPSPAAHAWPGRIASRAAFLSGLLACLLVTSQRDEAAPAPADPGRPVLAVEDTFLMPTTTLPEYLVEAPRVTLDEILRRVAEGEARRDSLMRDQSYTAIFKVVYADDKGETRVAREVASHIYKKQPDRVREVRLHESGDEMFEFSASPNMREQWVSFAFRPESRASYDFQILDRSWLGGHVIYRIAFEPRSDVDMLPTGVVWIDTNEFVIVRQEFDYPKGSPVPLMLKSFKGCVIERTRVDGDFWVWTRFLVRVETTSVFRMGAKMAGHPVDNQVDFSIVRLDWQVNRGLPDSLFTPEPQ